MTQITPNTSQLQSSCDIDIETRYYDDKGRVISNSSIKTARDLGFDVDTKFTHLKELVIDLKVGSYNPSKITIQEIGLIKEALEQLKNPTTKGSSDLAAKVLQLQEQSNNCISQGWFTLTKKPDEDVEITFGNGETYLIPAKQLKLKVFSDFVPNEYYSTSCVLRSVGGHEVFYYPVNDYIKIGCNKVKFSVVTSYLEDIERDYDLLLQCLDLPEKDPEV